MMVSGVYTITNLENDKIYLGSAIDIKRRWREHRHELRKGIHHNPHLQRSWDKYGKDVFEFNVLEYLDDSNELIKVEQFWLDKYREEDKELYNIALVAGAPMLGRKQSEETKRKIGDANRGRKMPPKSKEARRKTGEANKGNKYALGHKHTKETKRKISEAGKRWKRAPMSKEQKQKLSKANKGKKLSEEHKHKIRESMRGKQNALGNKHSEESKQKISIALTGRKLSEDHKRKLSKAKKGKDK